VNSLECDPGYWKSRHADAVERNATLQGELNEAQAEIRHLRDERFGKKSEKQYGSGVGSSNRMAIMLFFIFATLVLWLINLRIWLSVYFESCAQAGSKAPDDVAELSCKALMRLSAPHNDEP